MNPVRISVIVPCLNEEKTIAELLSAILSQTISIEWLEVIIADGMSTDHTRERITAFSHAHPELDVRVVDNLQRTIPAALNQAIRASTGQVIVRMDAHAIPAPDYIEKSLAALTAGFGENVGGVIEVKPGGSG
ncbi:MAG TPA: glycosyltransferase, partial [Anaerolineaceae bacterium]|nr:glycosyltransferase [Anaerolineaceae bacterium]